jgi:hypothetical protein
MDPAKVEARVRAALAMSIRRGGHRRRQVNAAPVSHPVLGVRLQSHRLMTAAPERREASVLAPGWHSPAAAARQSGRDRAVNPAGYANVHKAEWFKLARCPGG